MVAEPNTPYLETPEVLRLSKLPYSTLDYWVRTGLITPTVRGEWMLTDSTVVGSRCRMCPSAEGTPGRWRIGTGSETSPDDPSAHLTATLRDRGMLYWDGGDLIQIDEWENLVSLFAAPGQSVLHVVALSVDALRAEARESVAASSR